MNENDKSVPYADLRALNVNEHVERKNGMAYLSWVWAVDQLMLRDPSADWEYERAPDGTFALTCGKGTAMVVCTLTAFGRRYRMQLPVMDNRNKPIVEPDSFAINNAMMRCLVKAIALTGIGLYIYAGEDVPPDEGRGEQAWPEERADAFDEWVSDTIARVKAARDAEAVRDVWKKATATISQGGPPPDVLKAAHAAIKAVVIERGESLAKVPA